MRDDIKIMTRRDLTWTMVNIYLVSGNVLLDGILITCRSSFWLLYDDSFPRSMRVWRQLRQSTTLAASIRLYSVMQGYLRM